MFYAKLSTLIIGLALVSPGAFALTCPAAFPSGSNVSGSSAGSDAHTDLLDYGTFQTSSSSQDYNVSSGNTETVGANDTQDYDNLVVYGTLNFSEHSSSTVYKIDKLQLKSNATVNLVTGTYWVKRLLIGSGATINISGTGTVRIYVRDKFTVGANSEINNDSDHLETSKLLIISKGQSYSELRINSGSAIKGFIQHANEVVIENNVDYRGGITGDSVTIEGNTEITYDATAIASVDGGSVCDPIDVPDAPVVLTDLESCSASFPGGLTAHDAVNPDAIVKFFCGAQFLNAPSSVLTAEYVTNPSSSCAKTCDTVNCSATGSPEVNKLTYGVFQPTSSSQSVTATSGNTESLGASLQGEYYDVTANSGGTVNFTKHLGAATTYKVNNITVNDGGVVNLVPGDYWVERLLVNNGGTLNITGEGTARLFIRSKLAVGDNANVNNADEAHAASKLFIISRGEEYEDVFIGENTNMKAFLYHEDDVIVKANSVYTGGISAEDIDLKENVIVYYDDPDEMEGSELCDGTEKSGVSHYQVFHTTNSYQCSQEEIVVHALDSDNQIVLDYSKTIELNTGSGYGTWSLLSGNGTLVDGTENDGIAYYTFDASDSGVATFALDYANETSINISVAQADNPYISDDGSHGTLTYSPYGFLITENALSDSDVASQPAFSANQTAGVADDMHITVYGNIGSGQCGVYTAYTGNKSLGFWMDYSNPSTGTLKFKIDDTEVGIAESSAVTKTVSFSDGRAQVEGIYHDVGQVKVNVKEDLESGDTIYGSTSNFVVTPSQFVISSLTGNPEAADASGSIFKKAGESFSVTVTVQDALGNTTPNYGNESTAEGIRIFSSTLVAPTGGRNGTNDDGAIENGTNFTKIADGVFEATGLSFDEVGIIKLTAGVASEDYLGAGDVSGPESDNVGRFTPNHFESLGNSPQFTAGCESGGFTYLGQSFTYSTSPVITVTAKNLAGVTTQNYTGDFFKLNTTGVTPAYSINGSVSLESTVAESDKSVVEVGSGVGTVNLFDGGGFVVNKNTGENIANFSAEIQLATDITDADNITLANQHSFGGTESGTGMSFSGGNNFYQGRIKLINNYGSELLPLTIPVKLEYFNGSFYVPNTNDSCTTFTSANVSFTTDPESLVTDPSVVEISNGEGSIVLSAPTPNGTTGQVDIELDLSSSGANLPHLQHDWPNDDNSDGNFNDNPTSRGSFGIYDGEQNVIYIRQVH